MSMQLELVALGDLEVPVAVMRGLDSSVIRTAPIFTNVRNLWQSHLKLHEVKSGPQPYAHVKASMVRASQPVRQAPGAHVSLGTCISGTSSARRSLA
jgi:hypothetical protein